MSSNTDKVVRALLDKLAQNPEGNTVKDDILGAIFSYLYSVQPNHAGEYHWFCSQAGQLTIDAATFCIRLFAYDSQAVHLWKERLRLCVSRCASCVQGLEVAKEASRKIYMSTYDAQRLDSFFTTFEGWELETFLLDNPYITQDITQEPANPPSPPSKAALYRMLCNWAIISDRRVAKYLQSNPPLPFLDTTTPPPPGVLVLLFVDSPPVRQWAMNACTTATLINPKVDLEYQTSPYFRVLYSVIPTAVNTLLHAHGGQGTVLNHYTLISGQQIWPSLYSAIRLLPPTFLKAQHPFALPQLILSHLGDVGEDFSSIFNCFVLLVKRLRDDMWMSQGLPSPTSVLTTLQQNPLFLPSTEQPNISDHSKSHITGLREFVATTRNSDMFSDTSCGVLNILLGSVKNSPRDGVREASLQATVQLLTNEWRQSSSGQHVAAEGLKRNAELVISVLYSEETQGDTWSTLLSEGRKLVEDVLSMDCHVFERTASGFNDAIVMKGKLDKEAKEKQRGTSQRKHITVPTFTFSPQLWDQFCQADRSRNPHLFASAVRLAGKLYHLFNLRLNVYKPLQADTSVDVEDTVNRFNASLTSLHNGLSQLITGFTNYSMASDGLSLLQQDGVLAAVVYMMLSQSSALESAAKALVGLAYDVDGRAECLRAILQHHPKQTMKAMMEYLTLFHRIANKVPEACDSSAALVRCFADILDVLCAHPEGLLHRNDFLMPSDPAGPASCLPKFWRLLAKSLATIYDRTPMWSIHVSTPEMVSWMRDALILARDVMKQWPVIENAINPGNMQGPHKLSQVGKDMIGDLQDFLPAVVKWLRLTDEELLHQSFSLLQNVLDVMKETEIRPSDKGLTKLKNFVNSAQEAASKKREQRTRLDSGRLLSLVKSLAQFDEDDDDEVEIVERPAPSKPSKSLKAKEVAPPKPEVKKPYIMSKTSGTTKPSLMPSRVTKPPAARKLSEYFTEKDQEHLESASSMPSFRRASTSTQPVASTSKVALPSRKSGIKNESAVEPAQAEDASSSDEDEDESDDDIEQTVGALGRLPKMRSPVKPQPRPRQTEKRQVIMLDGNFNAVKSFHRNSLQESRNRALRMKPDIGDLHRTILSWDYNHDGPSPPGPPLRLLRVPQTFQNYQHYISVFRPLLLMECWHSLLQSKDEKPDSYSCVIDSRQFESDWLNVEVTLPGSVKDGWYLAETDVVLLAQPGNPSKCILGKVKGYRASPLAIQATIRCFIKSGPGDPGLQITSKWQVSKVFSLSTINREYEALVSLQYNRICPNIMNPALQKPQAPPQQTVEEVMERYNVNEPQAAAILNAIASSSFSLIQGPPGTGKTSTICGLISRFLSERPRAPVPIHVGKTANAPQPVVSKQKILLCAPSNAAIDELVQRLKDGYVGAKKSDVALNVVRIGADSAINNSVRDVSLDYLVDQRIDSTSKPLNEMGEVIKRIRQEIDQAKKSRQEKLEQLKALNGVADVPRCRALEEEIQAITKKRNALMSQLDDKKDKQKSDYRALDALRRNTRRDILLGADVICSTLSGAGHESLEGLEFDMIIIDEAAQSIELSSLIPLRFECQRCVMVGDPKQLPPTVLSPKAKDLNYGQSLFARLHESCQDAVQLLSIQYRMHPSISYLPSSLFYNQKLLDGPDMERKTAQPWHSDEHFLPYRFFNVSKGLEKSSGRSMVNEAESQIAVALYERLGRQFSQVDFSFRVGVVSMYRAQLTTIKRSFEQRFGKDILGKVDFNTVDGFQGQEKDIIILSCVRAGPGLTSIGFLNDMRRMNVALTRAKSSLFILGNAATLERSDDTWRQIVQDARTRSSLVEVTDVSYFSRYTASAQPGTLLEGPPPKKKMKTAPESAPIPANLVRPNEFKQSGSKGKQPKVQPPPSVSMSANVASSKPAPAVTTQPILPPQPPERRMDAPTTSVGPSNISAGVKRPAPDDQIPTNAVPSMSSGKPTARPNPPPPPNKKSKPNTMFIPKKKR